MPRPSQNQISSQLVEGHALVLQNLEDILARLAVVEEWLSLLEPPKAYNAYFDTEGKAQLAWGLYAAARGREGTSLPGNKVSKAKDLTIGHRGSVEGL